MPMSKVVDNHISLCMLKNTFCMWEIGTEEPKLPPDVVEDLKKQLEDTSGGDLAVVEATSTGRGESTCVQDFIVMAVRYAYL